MEHLTAALLSCPIPASYALRTGDRDNGTSSEFRALPRLCAAASLAALDGVPSRSAVADASSSSERTPEMLQERGASSSEQALSGASPTDVLLLQAASKAAAARAVTATEDSAGRLLPPIGDHQQQQFRVELLRKALREHITSSGTDAYVASSSMSLRSVSTQASSVPDATASRRRALVRLSPAAARGQSLPAAQSLDPSQCSPFSSPSSSASLSVSSPPLVHLLARATGANGLVPQCVSQMRSPPAAAAEAAARYVMEGTERAPSPAEAMGKFGSVTGSRVQVDKGATGTTSAATTAAAADLGAGGEGQQQRLFQTMAIGGHGPPFFGAERVHTAATEAVAAATECDVTTATVTEHTSIAAAAAVQMLAKVFADTSAITANGSCAAAENFSEAAAYALLAAAGGVGEGAASTTARSETMVLSSRLVPYTAEKAENKVRELPGETATAKIDSRRGGRTAVLQQTSSSGLVPSPTEDAGLKNDGTALFSEGNTASSQLASGVPNSRQVAAAATAAGTEPAAATAVVQNLSAAAAAARSLSCATTAAGTAVPCCDSNTGKISGCNTLSSPLGFTRSSRQEASSAAAAAAADVRAEQTARKKRLRESPYTASFVRGSVTSAPVEAAAVERMDRTTDSKRAAPAVAVSVEAWRGQRHRDDGSGDRAPGARAAAHSGVANAERRPNVRKVEKAYAAGAADTAAVPVVGEIDDRVSPCTAVAGGVRENCQTALLTAAAELCAASDPSLRDINEVTAAAENAVKDAGRHGRGTASGKCDNTVELLGEENATTPAAAASDSSTTVKAAAQMVEGEAENAVAPALAGARGKPTHEGGGNGKGKRACASMERELLAEDDTEQSEVCEMCTPEQIGYLAATTYFSRGAVARALPGNGGGLAERNEQECSTMSCNSRNSSGELLVLSTALTADSLQQEHSLPQRVKEEEEKKTTGDVVSREGRELALAFRKSEEKAAGILAGQHALEANVTGCVKEESRRCSADSRPAADKVGPAERQLELLSEEQGRTVLMEEKQKQEQQHCEAQQQQDHEGKKDGEQQQGQQIEEQQQHEGLVQLQQRELEEQQQEEEEEETLVQEGGSCFVGGDESNSCAWEKMDDGSSVPPLLAYKSLSWIEGFSLPLGKIGRQKLLRQVRLKYHRNREHWRAKLHEKGFDVTSLPRMGVEQLWAVAQQMDLFDVACIIAHEHATRRQHRSGGGGGGGGGSGHGGVGGGASQGTAAVVQQQPLPVVPSDGGGLEGAAAAAGGQGGSGGSAGDTVISTPALLSDTTTASCVGATLTKLPSMMQGEASSKDVCSEKVLGNALVLLADTGTDTAAAVPYACSGVQTELGERRGGQHRPRGAGTKDGAVSRSSGGSVPGSSSPQGRNTRMRCRFKTDDSRHDAAAAPPAGRRVTHGRCDSATEATTAARKEEGQEVEEEGDSREEAYAPRPNSAGTEAPQEDEEEEAGDHRLLLLQEDEGERGERVAPEDVKNPALVLQQQQERREALLANEAGSREREGGRALSGGEADHVIRVNQEEAAAAAAAVAAATAAAAAFGVKKRICGMYDTGDGADELAGDAATSALTAATESAASGWISRGTARRSKKKLRQEPLSSCGNVGELLSEVCAEALREAVACATDATNRPFDLQTASSSACLQALALAEAAAVDESRAAAAEAAAAAAEQEAAAAATAAGAAAGAATGTSEAATVAAVEGEENLCEAALREVQIAAAANVCSHFLKTGWGEAESGVSAYVRQQQERLPQPQRQQRVGVEGEIRIRKAGDMARWCVAMKQREEEENVSSYRECYRSAAAGLASSETEELALLLQQQFASSTSSYGAGGCARRRDDNLYSVENAVTAAAAGKERKEVSPTTDRQEQAYDGGGGRGSGTAPARVSRGRQRSQREKQRSEKDKQHSLNDQRQVREFHPFVEEEIDEIRDVCKEMQLKLVTGDDAFLAGGAAVLGSSRSDAGPSMRTAQLEAAATPTEAATNSAAEATPLSAAAAGDLLRTARDLSAEELGQEEQKEERASLQLLEQQMLERAAAAAAQKEEQQRNETEELAETKRCVQDALSEIYMRLNNGLRGTTSASPGATRRHSSQKDDEAAPERQLCCTCSVEAGSRMLEITHTTAVADAAHEAPAAEAETADTCWFKRNGRKKKIVQGRDWERPYRQEDGSSSSSGRDPYSGGRSNSCCRTTVLGNVGRQAVVCEETSSTRRGGEREEFYKRGPGATGYLDTQLAERLQQRMNDLQGQLDEVKMQLHQLLKLNSAAEAVSGNELADAMSRHTFAAGDAGVVDCGAPLSMRAEEKYRAHL